ncbi:GIY-YIG nuclease family protein [Pseudomonas atacamensis]|uniref:GIY-YIG nuclease family protein n=1 Tax=Pseudomonas atacamensis TaxID=2565368 RepID=UPI003C8B6EB7
MRRELTFTDAVRRILREHPGGMTPQGIRELVKLRYPEHYGTESHVRNVKNGNYKDIDHALLARIYIACRSATDIFADKTQKPHKMYLGQGAEFGELEADDFIEGENLEKLAGDVGTLYVLGTNLHTADGLEIVKIGITTGTVEKRIAQLYTTGVPFRFRIISQWEVTGYAKLEQALHCFFDRFRINKAREFFTAECLRHIPSLIGIYKEVGEIE